MPASGYVQEQKGRSTRITGKQKYGERETVHDVKHTTSSAKQCGGNVMGWAFMTASGTDILVITDDEHYTADRCSRSLWDMVTTCVFGP